MVRQIEYEATDSYPDAVAISSQCAGVAWWVRGWETEQIEDWSFWEAVADEDGEDAVPDDAEPDWLTCRTGMLVCTMVGDDALFLIDPDDVQQIAREDYCGQCGQLGCHHDGLSR